MITIVRKIYRNTLWGRNLINYFLRLRNRIFAEETILKWRFTRMLGYSLNLKAPKSFNEKIQWLKLNDRSPLHVQCADKFAVREYIKTKIGEKYLVPLAFSTKNAFDIVSQKLPDYPVIIKANHTSGGVKIIRDKSKIDWEALRIFFGEQLENTYDNERGKGEWQYEGIVPRLVVEKLLMDENGQIPSDFKFFCCNGKVEIIQVDMDRSEIHKRNMYDTNWNLLPFELKYSHGRNIVKPHLLKQMISLAEKLAQDFIFVRADFYCVQGNIYFGELTFHPESGFGKFKPKKWDYQIGDMLKLPI
ncbi:ATP-grasp fold amidoligase family protein [Maribacter sp. ACAM166]|uniref:ATP-grasp fold amidoligase family protein n=1 Tax=Maribacter sp. ACAM166 TaxID=2508996 RepID=UPI0010FD7459|nr:ATP-grasp fold amidoligase family protein [Maribacter sp. ACAM166]TLP70631.1 glycosyl transferase [Maribacter sp. ACAM166]